MRPNYENWPSELIWPTFITQTEAGDPFNTPRYRPVYYFLRLVETWAWGEEVILWYAGRVSILIFFTYQSVRVLQRTAGTAYGLIFILSVIFSRTFVDIFSRLGPSEVYTVLGCALYLYALNRISSIGLKTAEAIMIALGSLLSIGSKENFIFLVLPLAIVLVSTRARSTIMARAIVAIIFFACLIIWSAILPVTLGLGTTIYQDSVPQIAAFQNYPIMLSVVAAVLGGMVLLLFAHLLRKHYYRQESDFSKQEQIFLVVFFAIAIALQLIVYGDIKFGNGYGFPAAPMLVFILLTIISNTLNGLQKQKWPLLERPASSFVIFAAMVLIAVIPEIKSIKHLYSNVKKTQAFHQKYNFLVQAVRTKPDADVVFVNRMRSRSALR